MHKFVYFWLTILAVSLCLQSCSSTESQPQDWRIQIAQQSITQDVFNMACLQALKELHPEATVKKLDSSGYQVSINGVEIRTFLDNAWKDTQSSPEYRAERCLRQWSGFAELTNEEDTAIRQQDIVPVIKDIQYLKGIESMAEGKQQLYNEFFVADLVVVYAEDSEYQLSYLSLEDVEQLGMTPDALRELSIYNLQNKLTDIERLGNGPAYMLTAGGNFEASLLLLDHLWPEQESLVEGELVVVLPARDIVAFTGSDSAQGLKQLANIVEAVMQENSYVISDTKLVRRNNQWLPLQQ